MHFLLGWDGDFCCRSFLFMCRGAFDSTVILDPQDGYVRAAFYYQVSHFIDLDPPVSVFVEAAPVWKVVYGKNMLFFIVSKSILRFLVILFDVQIRVEEKFFSYWWLFPSIDSSIDCLVCCWIFVGNLVVPVA